MIVKIPLKLYFLLIIIVLFLLNFVKASDKKSEDEENKKNKEENTDKFYLVLVKNELKKDGNKKGHVKREEKEQFLDALVTEINSLIIGNKDTYDDPSVLEELEQASTPSTPFSKRSVNEDDREEAEKHKFAYVISSLEKESLVFSYLSEDLVPLVNDLPNIEAVVPDIKMERFSGSHINLNTVKKTVKDWKVPCVKESASNHLSLISQNKYDDSKNNTSYDESYYYPSSAGEDINIFILDDGFNFKHEEFKNKKTKDKKNERIAQCIYSANQMEVYDEFTDKCTSYGAYGHGNAVANVVGGLNNGVASKANIYGIDIQYKKDDDVIYLSSAIKGLEHINFNYLDPENPENLNKFINKTIINMSNGIYFTEYEKQNNFTEVIYVGYFYSLINAMSENGAIFVVAAGNDQVSVDDLTYPCSFDNVICVGATDNIGLNEDYYKLIELEKEFEHPTKYTNYFDWVRDYKIANETLNINYVKFMDDRRVATKNYRKAFFSNFGQSVDIYAPGFVKIPFQDKDDVDQVVYAYGTSFSSPIVAGVAATIMSENPNDTFTTSSMKKYLQEHGLKDIINDIGENNPNYFINNGKYLDYDLIEEDEDDEYEDLECLGHGCCLLNNPKKDE